MFKKLAKDSIAATHRLTLEIGKPPAAVCKAFTGAVHSRWPKDHCTESPKRMVLELKPGGRLYEMAVTAPGSFRLLEPRVPRQLRHVFRAFRRVEIFGRDRR